MKKMNKNESKYFNTALLMNEALLNVLEKKDFDFITIKEICHKAGVNRSTFYLHYQNLNDLLEETIEMLSKKFYDSFEAIKDHKEDKFILVTPKYLEPYLKFVKENKKVYSLVHRKPEIFNNEQYFNKFIYPFIDGAMKANNVPLNKVPYVLEFYTKGVLAIIFKWIERNCEDDINLIIDLITDFTKQHDQKN